MDNGLLVRVDNIDHHMFVRRQILSRTQRRGRSRCPRKKSLLVRLIVVGELMVDVQILAMPLLRIMNNARCRVSRLPAVLQVFPVFPMTAGYVNEDRWSRSMDSKGMECG